MSRKLLSWPPGRSAFCWSVRFYMLCPREKGLQFQVTPADRREEVLKSMTTEERGVADWVVKNNKRAGATTNTLSHAQNLYLAVRGLQGSDGRGGDPLQILSGA